MHQTGHDGACRRAQEAEVSNFFIVEPAAPTICHEQSADFDPVVLHGHNSP